MRDRIQFTTTRLQPVINKFERYVERTDSRLKRLLLWLAVKFGAIEIEPFSEILEYSRHDLDMQDISRAVLQHKANVEQITNRRAKYLIIGNDQFADLMAQMPIHLGQHGLSYAQDDKRKIYGLETIIVPYLDGMFILPDLEQR